MCIRDRSISVKFDDLSNALCKRIDERFQTAIKRIQDDVDNVTRNTGKCSGNVTENKVSNHDNYSNELTNNSKIKSDNEIIKNVLENKVNNNSGEEVLVEIESSNKIVVEERLGLQRANFPHDLNGVKTPIVSYEDRVSSRGYRAVSYTHLDVYKRQGLYLDHRQNNLLQIFYLKYS